MRIAVDLRSLMESGGRISGVENYTLRLIEQYPNMNIGNAQFFGFYNSFKKTYIPLEHSDSFLIVSTHIPNKVINASITFLHIPKFENLYDNFDVLWMPDLRPFSITAKTKLALTVHDLSPIMYPEFYSLKRRLWHRVIKYKQALTRANIIFAVSEYTKFDIIKLFGIDPKKIVVAYPGIDHSVFHPHLDQGKKDEIAKKHDLPKRFILSVSTIEPRKNIIGLVSAFEQIADPNIDLVISGRTGWVYDAILTRISKSPKKDKIHVLGYIDEAEKPYIISLAEMVCYPSFYEGFGFVPLESFACGTPAITSARTSMPEVCADAALLVEPGQISDLVLAIDSLCQDAELRFTLTKKGLIRAQMFDWHKTATMVFNHLMNV